MRLIDEQYLRTPFYGWPRMTAHLRRQGYAVNHKRVQRLMQKMGLQAIYPKPRTSRPAQERKIYPYLLRDLEIVRPNQVWRADITYVPMRKASCIWSPSSTGSVAMCLTWQLSNTLDGYFCVEALQQALPQANPPCSTPTRACSSRRMTFTSCLERADDPDQHGRSWPCFGQHLRRAPLAQRQVRGHLPEGLRHCA